MSIIVFYLAIKTRKAYFYPKTFSGKKLLSIITYTYIQYVTRKINKILTTKKSWDVPELEPGISEYAHGK